MAPSYHTQTTVATEDDYQTLEVALRQMPDFDVDQFDSDDRLFTMLVHVGHYVVMDKKRVQELVADFRREQKEQGASLR